jgi:hypothetical protein
VPDVVVAGSLLWHVLHVSDAEAFEHDLGHFVQSSRALWQCCEEVSSVPPPVLLVWCLQCVLARAGLAPSILLHTTARCMVQASSCCMHVECWLTRLATHLICASHVARRLPTEYTRPDSYRVVQGASQAQIWWARPSQVVPGKLTAADKARTMTSMRLQKYTDATDRALSAPWPSTTVQPLDMLELSRDCGPSCTSDGLHYCIEVYRNAVLQVIASSM